MQSNPIGCPSADLQIFILLTPLKFHPANTVVNRTNTSQSGRRLIQRRLLAPVATNSWSFRCEICTSCISLELINV
jgi:hypothetical protein